MHMPATATSALHIACLSLGVGEGDMVWTSPISFVASSNCALYCNADVDFVDINPITYNLSVSALEKKLKVAKRNGRLQKLLYQFIYQDKVVKWKNDYFGQKIWFQNY